MTIKDIFINIKYQEDASSKQKVNKDIEETGKKGKKSAGDMLSLFSTLGKVLAAIKAMKVFNNMIEEIIMANRNISSMVSGIEDVAKAQEAVLDAATATNMAYKSMATTISKMISSRQSFVDTAEEAGAYAENITKLLKVSGFADEQISSMSNSIASSLQNYKFVDNGIVSQMVSQNPSLEKYFAKALGINYDGTQETVAQLKAILAQIPISSKQLYDVITMASDEMNETYDNMTLTFSEQAKGILESLKVGFNEIAIDSGLYESLIDLMTGVKELLINMTPLLKVISDVLGWWVSGENVFFNDLKEGVQDFSNGDALNAWWKLSGFQTMQTGIESGINKLLTINQTNNYTYDSKAGADIATSESEQALELAAAALGGK